MYNSSISIALIEISIYRKNECSKKWKEKCKRGFFIVRNLAKKGYPLEKLFSKQYTVKQLL